MKKSAKFLAAAAMCMLGAGGAFAQAFADIEYGAAFTGYNNVAIPADTGTKISLKDDTNSALAQALRLRLGYTIAGRHTVSVLIAPLTVYGTGKLDREVEYQGIVFPAGEEVSSTYRFDSYRLTYRYSIIDSEDFKLALGLSGKIRSADIALMSENGYAHRSDLGVVPLVNFSFLWNFNGPFSLLVDGDALGSPYGRAEDVLAAIQYAADDRATFRLGYRVLEGGSDGGGNVYTFALFHYITAGLTIGL